MTISIGMDRVDTFDHKDIQDCLAGDEQAFVRIVRRYETDIARQMWRFTRDRTEHDELVQEVFVQAWKSLSGFKGNSPLLHWLRRIASRTGFRLWKKKTRERAFFSDSYDLDLERYTDQSSITANDAADAMYIMLEKLPVRDRMVLTLHYFEELTFKEIADRMGWSVILVKVTAHRARKKLKARLEEAGFGRES